MSRVVLKLPLSASSLCRLTSRSGGKRGSWAWYPAKGRIAAGRRWLALAQTSNRQWGLHVAKKGVIVDDRYLRSQHGCSDALAKI
jgi:hypothetical protein